MLKSTVLALGFSILVFTTPSAHAGRLAAYSLDCVGFPGSIATGFVQGFIETTQRIIMVRGSCHNAPSTTIWPEVQDSDGEVLSMEMQIIASVDSKPGYPSFHATTPCTVTSRNGFIDRTCIANPNRKTPSGLVQLLISIVPPAE